MPVLKRYYFNNSVLDYLIFLACALIGVLLIWLLSRFLLGRFIKRAEKTETTADNIICEIIKKRLVPIAYLIVLFFSTKLLVFTPRVYNAINTVFLALIVIMGALFVSSLLVFLFSKYWKNKNAGESNEMALRLLTFVIKLAVWIVALFLFLDNLGIKINSLIAGLGIGGIAIAFAAQAILADIFCFFSIFFDRPFEIGDYIVFGEFSGTVEHIGVKTTRLRTLSGEQLICSNTDLTSSRIRNYKTMRQRRIVFTLQVTHDTDHDRLREIPGMVKEIIEETPDTSFSRAHFAEFGEYSLDYTIVYYVLSGDYAKYMDVHQDILFKIKDAFDKSGIRFAYPTRTLHMGNPKS